jgi:hypothetical protein
MTVAKKPATKPNKRGVKAPKKAEKKTPLFSKNLSVEVQRCFEKGPREDV